MLTVFHRERRFIFDGATGEPVGGYHDILHWAVESVGYHMASDMPTWLHLVLHVVFIWAPAGLLTLLLLRLVRLLRRGTRPRARSTESGVGGLPNGVLTFVLRSSRWEQLTLVGVGLLSMPILYATLELPKIIINNAIDSNHFPVVHFGQSISQTSYLFAFCGLYLVAIAANGTMKFWLNVYKGRVGEALLRRLRLSAYRCWRRARMPGTKNAEMIPLITQEVEPVGGFAADAFALPAFQGGTFLTIVTFMFMQDAALGAAALTLLPVQIAVIPRLQRRVNRLARKRVGEIRALARELDNDGTTSSRHEIRAVGARLKRIQAIRLQIHRSKYFIKGLNNFLTALTPFFFYSVGGYLVIEERLSLGALVAVLAAYKDFSTPVRELLRYYQTLEDVRVRYREILRFLTRRDAGDTETPVLSRSAKSTSSA